MPAASQRFEIIIDGNGQAAIRALDQVDRALDKTGKQSGFVAGLVQGVGQHISGMAMGMVSKIPAAAAELFQLGVQAETVSHRFEAFAGSAEAANAYLDAFRTATDGTVSKIDAMAGASKMLQMGLVSNADEMETMASIAVKLGDQTMGAGNRLADFSALLANRSIPRLDNFGISSSKVRARVEELKEAGYDLDEAFKLAVLEQGRISLETLGDTAESTATRMAQMQASWQDAKTAMGTATANIVVGTGALDEFNGSMQTFAQRTEAMVDAGVTWRTLGEAMWESLRTGQSGNEVFDSLIRRSRDLSESLEIQRYGHYNVTQAVEAETDAVESSARATESYAVTLARQAGKGDFARQSIERMEEAAAATRDEIVRLDQATADFAGTQLSLSMQFTGQLESMEESAERFAQRREDLEAEHQEKLADLQRRGQSSAIRIDEQAERDKLAQLQRNLEIAQQQQAEFTDKTKQSTLMRKDDQIAGLQAQIAEQEKLLDDYEAGRLVRAGQNVDALIAEEQRRHDAAITALDEEMAKQEQIQEKALGNMMLNAFDAWAQQQEAMGKALDVKPMMEMRTKIAEEYGLVEQGAADFVTDMLGELDSWASGTGASTDEVVGYLGNVLDATGDVRDDLLELTAETYWIRVRYDIVNPDSGRQPYDVPFLPPGNPSDLSAGNTYNSNDTYNFYTPHGYAAVQESRRRDRRRRMGRTM